MAQYNTKASTENQPQDGTIIPLPANSGPFSREAEQSVLGNLILGEAGFKAWSQVKSVLVAVPKTIIITTFDSVPQPKGQVKCEVANVKMRGEISKDGDFPHQ